MNIIIASIGYLGIVMAKKTSISGSRLIIKNHFLILGGKVVSIVGIIYIFHFMVDSNIQTSLILTGMFNLIIFHFMEAFVVQRKLIQNRKLNV